MKHAPAGAATLSPSALRVSSLRRHHHRRRQRRHDHGDRPPGSATLPEDVHHSSQFYRPPSAGPPGPLARHPDAGRSCYGGQERSPRTLPDAPSPQRQLNQDLGLGGKLSERSRVRLLNRDGTFNVRRNSLSPLHPYNAYHTLLSLSIPKLIALMATGYLATNVSFAALYWLSGPDALSGAESAPWARLEDCFFFSVQTLATIGYGKLVPATRLANSLVAVEALVGLLGFAVLSGLLFARFTRPSAKIIFSRHAIIAPYEGGWALMFRLANLRNHDLTDVHAVVSLAHWVDDGGTRRRRFDQLPLERDFIIFMPLHWVVVHPINSSSPLHGMTPDALDACDPEIVCMLTADDETFAQTVHAKTSYDKADIVWGARFRDIYLPDTDRVAIDLSRLHDVESVPPPPSV